MRLALAAARAFQSISQASGGEVTFVLDTSPVSSHRPGYKLGTACNQPRFTSARRVKSRRSYVSSNTPAPHIEKSVTACCGCIKVSKVTMALLDLAKLFEDMKMMWK